MTDDGKVFTGRFGAKDVEVLFDRICRENGIDHLLTALEEPGPTTTGNIERFHRTLRSEFLAGRVFADLPASQLEGWVDNHNTQRPHQGPRHGHARQPVHGPGSRTSSRCLGAFTRALG